LKACKGIIFDVNRRKKQTTMKKQLSLAAAFLFVLTGIAGCKKEGLDKFKTEIIGQWQISKAEAVSGQEVVLPVLPGDYYDFKEGEDDIVEVRRNGNLQSGTYVATTSREINMTIGGKLYTCKVTALDGNKLEFTATQGGSSEKVFLKR
jgi:hypothetical protein